MTPDVLKELRCNLVAFHRGLHQCPDDHSRFAFVLDQMWDVFVSRNVEDGDDGDPWSVFALDDNLDTGNAARGAILPFQEALVEAVSDPQPLRMYHGPWPISGLREAVMSYLVDERVVEAVDAPRLDVGVGAGTVNLWDAICRIAVSRRGDAVALPSIGYGFFVPQVARAGGHVLAVPAGIGGKLDPESVLATVDERNARLRDRWQATLRPRLAIYLDELGHRDESSFRKPPAAAIERLLVRARQAVTAGDVDALLRTFLETYGETSSFRSASEHLGPPRVTAYLHINPDVMGRRCGEAEVQRLAEGLAVRGVLIIEDCAYHTILGHLRESSSVMRLSLPAVLLLGLSKPFGIADCRVGLVVGEPLTTRRIVRAVETSVGWVPTFLQEALLALFQADRSVIAAYARENDHGEGGYLDKRNLIMTCLEGEASAHVPPASMPRCKELVVVAVDRLFASKRALGIDVCDDGFPGISDRASYQAEITQRFLRAGLTRWLELSHAPEHGFFVVVDCTRLLAQSPVGGVVLGCAFDVFALFASVAGVRTIPEEAMGIVKPATRHLRLAFSPASDVLVQTLFSVYVVLERLERWEDGGSSSQ